MKTFSKFLSAAVMTAALIFISCTKEHEEGTFDGDPISSNMEQISAKSRSGKLMEVSFNNKEDLKNILNSIQVLSKMKYPLKDTYAFEKALSSFDAAFLSKTFEKSYTKSDFPIYSFQEAFKVHYYNNPAFSPIRPIFPELPSLYPELPDEPRYTPSVCEVLENSDFTMAAKDCGCRTYSAAIRGGLNHLQATIEAVFAAINYDRGRGCTLVD